MITLLLRLVVKFLLWVRYRVEVRGLEAVAARGRRGIFDSDAWQKLSESACYSSAKAERELGYRASRTLLDALPEMVTSYVHRRIREVLSGEDDSEDFAHLSPTDRVAIRQILEDTKTEARPGS